VSYGAGPAPPPQAKRYGPVLAWTALFLGGLALASLATPLIYAALLELLPATRWPFSRVFNRTAMVIAVLLLVVLRRQFEWTALRALLRSQTAGEAAIDLLAGLGAALIGVALAVGGAFALDLLGAAASSYDFFAVRTATALAGGVAAALAEETFFRGLMLTALASSVGFRAAAIASSGAYALVHLLVSDPTLGRQGYTLGAGFAYFGHAIGRQLEPASVPPLIGLFLCGLVLAVAVRRTRSLYLAIGLHAGWAFAFQVLRHATRPLVEIPGHSSLATHHFLVGTLWAWAAVILSGALALAWCALPGSRATLAPANGRRGS